MEEMIRIRDKIKKFRDDRNWMQFHDPKNLAVSISIETAELLEHFQWKTKQEVKKYIRENKEAVADEIADIAIYLFELADNLKINILDSMHRKIEKNDKKYPVKKVKGIAIKYNRL